MFCKKELAGRTMEFTFDVSQTPLIGRRILFKTDDANQIICSTSVTNTAGNTTLIGSTHMQQQQKLINAPNSSANQIQQQTQHSTVGTPNSPRRSASLSPADSAPLSGWKRPWMSQGRVRECLVNLLTTCGQRVGLPKSPSVSFVIASILVFFLI